MDAKRFAQESVHRLPVDVINDLRGVSREIVNEKARDPSWILTFVDGSTAHVANPAGRDHAPYIIARNYDPRKVKREQAIRDITERLRSDPDFFDEILDLYYAD